MSKIEGHLAKLIEVKRPSTQFSVYVHTSRRPSGDDTRTMQYLGLATRSVGTVFGGFCNADSIRALANMEIVSRIRLVDEPDGTPPMQSEDAMPGSRLETLKERAKKAKEKLKGQFMIINHFDEDL